ncbi:tol-pal system protein YbgF [Thiocystis violacea]|nr:tol-pal system protein YbgF [Thiocystis violacea]
MPSLPAPETIGGTERDLYSQAFELLKDRKYEESKVAFNDLLRRYPQGEFADNARYWLGETYYVLREYPAAMAEYDRLVQLNPSSPKVPGAMLKIGLIQYDQKDFDQAKATLERVINSYPASTEARLAKSRLERIGRGTPP